MSIRIKLIATYLLVALVPLLFLGAITFHNYRDSLESTRISQLRDITAYKADHIGDMFSGLDADIQIAQSFYNIKTNLPVLSAMAGNPTGPEFVASKKMLDGQLRPMARVKGLYDILLTNPSGKIVYASNPAHWAKHFRDRLPGPSQKSFEEGKKRVYFSDIFVSIVEGNKPVMLVSAPVADFKGAFAGVVAFSVDMAPVYGLVQDATGLGKTGETVLGKKDGGEVIFLNPLKNDPRAALERRLSFREKFGKPIQEAVQGRAGSGRLNDYRGVEVIAAWRTIPVIGWGIVAKIDSEEAFAEARHIGHFVVLIMAVLILLCGLMAFFIAHSISDPIKKLSKGAAVIGGGNLDYKVGTGSKDEIGQLSRAFDAMTESLKKTTASRDALNEEIYERKQAERLLESERDNLRNIFDGVSVGMLLLDEKGAIMRVNNAITNWLGKKPEEIFGVQPGNALGCIHVMNNSAICGHTIACRDCSIREAFELVLRSGEPVSGLEAPAEFFSGGGQVKLWFEINANPLVIDGKKYVLLALNDISGRKRAEKEKERFFKELQENEDRLKKAQEISHLGSWELDVIGNRLSWSDEVYRIFGLKPQEFAATYEDFLEAIHPDDRAAVDAAYSGSLRAGRDSYEIEHRVVRRATGEVRVVHERCAHIRNAAGVIVRSVGMVHDITERKKMEEGLKRSNESLEQFAYVASHDLQEPLRMMASYSELLERRYKKKLDSDADEFINYIVDGAKRLQKLINDLLTYSRIGRAGKEVSGELDCNAILGRVLGGMKPAVEESGAVVTNDPLPALTGNESNFSQLFQNLIGNAIKFRGAEPPRVHIGAQRQGGAWLFSVKDNIGIEPQYKDRIFLIFQRLHGRGEYPGTGIGLSICKKIVETYGGRIWLESEPGKGSVFYFTIPEKGELKNDK